MASRNRNPNKPELVAIYRLEFYKNKKNWKISNEKQQNPSKPGVKPKKNGRNNTLNETYNVEPSPDSEKEKTSLNNAFMHEIPTDKSLTKSAEPLPPPLPLKTQEEPHTDQMVAPPPQPHLEDIWDNPEQPKRNLETVPHQNTWDDEVTVDKQPLYKSQDQPTWMNAGNQFSNQEQPNNLQWLLKTANMCHNQPTLRLPQPNTWHNRNTLDSTPVQNTWFKPPGLNQPLENACQKTQEHIGLKDQISWKNTREQYCSQSMQWNNQLGMNHQNCENIENPKKEVSFILPDTSVPPPPLRHQNAWPSNPKLQERWVNPNPGNTSNGIPTLPNPGDILLAGLRPAIDPGRQSPDLKFSQECNPGYFCPEKGQVWTNEPSGPNLEVLAQNVWVNQAWQEKEMWVNGDKEWCGPEAEDAPDGLYEEGGLYTEPHTIQADQCTLKPQPTSECATPEQIVRETDCWLRRLMRLNRLNDDWYECESVCDQYQRGYNESSDFVREAHDVAHSSENDPNDTLEWVWSLTSPASLPGLSPRRLAMATHHVSNTLRSLLQEQLIRDQLRSNRTTDVEEFPTRDCEAFPGEYVLSGSHLPRSTRQLAGTAPRTSLIKIDMGRPYRL